VSVSDHRKSAIKAACPVSYAYVVKSKLQICKRSKLQKASFVYRTKRDNGKTTEPESVNVVRWCRSNSYIHECCICEHGGDTAWMLNKKDGYRQRNVRQFLQSGTLFGYLTRVTPVCRCLQPIGG